MPRSKPNAAQVATDTDRAPAVQMSGPSYTRCTAADILAILEFHKGGYTQVQIAELVGCSQSTVAKHLADAKRHTDEVRALVASDIGDAVDNWKLAEKVAAERGDHRPARERIEIAFPVLRPTQGNSARGVGVTINIGQPGQPLELPSISADATFAPVLSPASTDVDAS